MWALRAFTYRSQISFPNLHVIMYVSLHRSSHYKFLLCKPSEMCKKLNIMSVLGLHLSSNGEISRERLWHKSLVFSRTFLPSCRLTNQTRHASYIALRRDGSAYHSLGIGIFDIVCKLYKDKITDMKCISATYP